MFKIKVTKPKVKVVRQFKCGMCGRPVTYNKPHKCPKRKTR